MSNEILRHRVVFYNHCDALKIELMDQPGAGGACHHYSITGFDTAKNPSIEAKDGYRSSFSRTPIIFQNGTVLEAGENGVTVEALLAICEHRLQCFQSGPFANDFNAKALKGVTTALDSLKQRTVDRLVRQVEGLHKL
jgi:hypothetical protein